MSGLMVAAPQGNDLLQTVSILEGVVIDPDQVLPEDEQWAVWLETYQLWLESIRRKSDGNNSVKAYKTAWKQFFKWAQITPWNVTPRLSQQWAAWLSHQGKALANGERGPLSKKSVNLKLAAMSSFYRYVQRTTDLWPADRRTPFDSVERYQTDPYDSADFPSETEAQAILARINRNVLNGKRDYALLYTFLVTCRRSAEILNLKWGDLAPSNSNPGDWVFEYRYKGGKVKRAVLDAHCYVAICEYLKADDRLETIGPDDFIFCRVRQVDHLNNVRDAPGKPIGNGMANKLLKKYARQAGVAKQKAHIHGLRHAGARRHVWQMKQNGAIDYEEIMNLLGHSNIAVTQIYIQTVLDDPESSTARQVARYFGQAEQLPLSSN